ncbi:hypothetical protein Desdi_2197 [Desulfitobacterium dichloroeliminans LMG P-21439]|uniref:Uncharacterized protein n=1 Tax=Desulfitobacterium dichloroeliminans (strain LMG P-21439 / DCA1) TaxID=871963 RepID=L0F8W4_DESDL|nr:hypothetical protein Desdi_2197 [Desulfitobacterium dichloroeliminans LMG P-21439]
MSENPSLSPKSIAFLVGLCAISVAVSLGCVLFL